MYCKIKVDGKELEIFEVSLKAWLETGKVESYTDSKGEWVIIAKPAAPVKDKK